jgi:hypothetical protein
MIVPPIPPAKLSAGPEVKVPYALSPARKVPPVTCGKTDVRVSPPTTEYGCPRMAPVTTTTRPDAASVFLGITPVMSISVRAFVVSIPPSLNFVGHQYYSIVEEKAI